MAQGSAQGKTKILDSSGNALNSTSGALNVNVSGDSSASNISLIASSAYTTSQQSADQVNLGSSSILAYLNVSAASGTGGLTLRIEGKDSVSGNYFYLNAAPTAVQATGQYGYVLGPGCVSSGGSIQQTTASILPKTWRIWVAVGDSSNYTYSVSASVIS
jgi:hypothetical protein